MADALTMLCTKRLAWRASLSAEDTDKLNGEKAAWSAEETKAERMAEFGATFQAADTNADGLLDRTEFEDFMGKLAANSVARDVPFQPQDSYSAEEKDAVFGVFNATNAETDGINANDFFATMAAITAKMQELA